jgi:hypothetical protein
MYPSLWHGRTVVEELSRPELFVAAGLQPGSSALQPLFSLASTLLKAANATLMAKPQPNQQDWAAVTEALQGVLRMASLVLRAVHASSTLCRSSGSGSGSSWNAVIDIFSQAELSVEQWPAERLSLISSSLTSPPPSNSKNSDAVVLMPWLVSLGRCCMLYALVQRQSQAGGAAWQAAFLSSRVSMAQALQGVAAVLPAWLQNDGVSAQLAAAGYSTQGVIEVLHTTVQAGQDAVHGGAAAVAAAVAPELLQQLGLALSNLPVGTVCNNPFCASLEGVSEQQLVTGRARLCAGCLVARYCCRACQVAAWKQHKPACKAVASARAAKPADQPHEHEQL